MTIRELTGLGRAALESAGVPDPGLDAEYLLAEALRAPRLALLVRKDEAVPEDAEAAFRLSLARRARREPLQYILGSADFYGYSFCVGPGVLIPRCDTEALCEAALGLLPRDAHADVLDLCTGSGALAAVIAKERPRCRVSACDLSGEALAWAERNAKSLGARVRFYRGDLFDALPQGQDWDLIVSNPPYVPDALVPRLQAEVRMEPAMALLGGADGLDFYRRIRDALPGRLRKGGCLCLETGDDQTEAVAAMLAPLFAETACLDDLSGHPRVVRGKGFGR